MMLQSEALPSQSFPLSPHRCQICVPVGSFSSVTPALSLFIFTDIPLSKVLIYLIPSLCLSLEDSKENQEITTFGDEGH